MSTVFGAATGWLLFAGLTLSIGAVIARWAILPQIDEENAPRVWLTKIVAGIAAFGAALISAAMVLYFLRQLQEFRDPFASWMDEAWLLLSSTSWGTAWILGAGGALVALWTTRLALSGREAGWWIATPVLLALGTFPGFTGHAAGEEELRVLTLVADWIHVGAASAWMGGLAVVLYTERKWCQERGPEASLLPTIVPIFSRVAIVAVAILAVTGAFASWRHLPTLGALVTTGYGRTLLLKLALVGVVLGVGGMNFRVLTPRLGSGRGNSAMRKAATIELAGAQLVLLTTALLVRTSPMDV